MSENLETPQKPPQKTEMSRRTATKVTGAAALTAAPFIQKMRGANNQVQYAVIGTGSRGSYHITHLNGIDSGHCVAVCDVDPTALAKAQKDARDKPQGFKDYREVLAKKEIEAVIIATPLYMHFPVTKDALEAGKHVFCEKSLVFKPEEIHALRKMSNDRPKQVLQVGLQRRYSKFYQTAKQMVDKGMIGKVTHVYGQWHRKSLPKTWVPPAWRAFRKYSGGLTAELASHQIDVADWMIGAHPEAVMGMGGLDVYKDGRDVYDNIQLIFRYPQGQKLMYSSICTNNHLSMFGSSRTEFGEMILGTEGTIHITVGTDNEPATALWFYEPNPKKVEPAKGAEKAAVANASLVSTGKGGKGLPVLFDEDKPSDKDSFMQKELKFAKMWLYKKGVMVPEENKNPVDVQLESFFSDCRSGKRPLADLEVGLEDSANVILANLAMDEKRLVFMNEMEKMGGGPVKDKPAAAPAKKA